MRESRKCIKCDCRKLFVLDPVQTEDPSTSWGVKPMPITVSMVQGRITAGSIEVWLCSRCGYMEWYAKDTEGAEMKLSDYRGKVILLDFWGFW